MGGRFGPNSAVEDPFEQPSPTHARRRALRLSVLAENLGGTLWRSVKGKDLTRAVRPHHRGHRPFLQFCAEKLLQRRLDELNSERFRNTDHDSQPDRAQATHDNQIRKLGTDAVAQMRGARENRRVEAYLPIRCSEAIERNPSTRLRTGFAGGPFSKAC